MLSIELRRNRLDLILKHHLSKGLSHALQRALNDSTVYAQVSFSSSSSSSFSISSAHWFFMYDMSEGSDTVVRCEVGVRNGFEVGWDYIRDLFQAPSCLQW